MSRSMVAFLAGLGGGYLRAQDKVADDERQAKRDARDDARFNREQKAWEEQDRLNQDLKDAAAPRTVVDGTVTESGGNKVLTTDPAQTAAIQKTLAEEAEMRGEAAPTTRAGQGVVGAMARGNEIVTDGQADAGKLNTADARNERVLGALQKNGQVERALSMQNSLLEQQAKRLGLDVAQAQFADEQFNRRLNERLAGPDFVQQAAQMFTETQVGGLAGAAVTARPTADGKRVEYVAAKDGQERVLGSIAAGEAGRAQLLQQLARVPLATKVGWIVEGEKTKREEERWQQTFDFNKKKEENDQQYRQRVLSIQMAQESRARQVHAIAMQDAKIPPGVKLQAQTLAKQMESINSAINKAMAEDSFDVNKPGPAGLIKQQRILGLQYQRLMAPYTPGSENKADPLGLNGGGQEAPAAAPGAAAPAAPAAPAARPVQPAAAAPASPWATMNPGAGAQVGPFGGAVPAAPAAGPMQQATAPAQPSVAEIIAGPGAASSPALMAGAQQKAQVIEGLAQQIKVAQAQVAQAARGNGDVKAAMDQVAALNAQVTQALAGMNEQQAAKVLAAAGIQ